MKTLSKMLGFFVGVTTLSALLGAQTPAPGAVNKAVGSQVPQPVTGSGSTPATGALAVNGLTALKSLSAAPNYVLGVDDQIVIQAFEADEISNKPIGIAGDGFIDLPMLGRVHAAGLTVQQLQTELTKRLGEYVNHPQLTVMVSEFRSQPASVMGAVNSAGVVQLQGRKTLMQVISLAGGLRQDAGNSVTITREVKRGKLPLANATTDAGGQFTSATVSLRDIMSGKKPEDNILIEPNDVLTIPKAQLIYVLGEVGRPGGFVLDDHDSLSSLQCVALAGGLNRTASGGKAKILRLEPGKTERKEIPTNLSKIMRGEAPDVPLHADDILFVPNNAPKSAGLRAAESAIQIGTGVAIWRF
jgi:polysaccharide export outer membrane protein